MRHQTPDTLGTEFKRYRQLEMSLERSSSERDRTTRGKFSFTASFAAGPRGTRQQRPEMVDGHMLTTFFRQPLHTRRHIQTRGKIYIYIRKFINKSQFIACAFDFLAIVSCLTGNKKADAVQHLLLAQQTVIAPEFGTKLTLSGWQRWMVPVCFMNDMSRLCLTSS